VSFASDLRTNIENGDANYLSMLDEADAYITRNGLDLPEEPQARILGPDPDCMTKPDTRARPRSRRHHLDRLGDRLRLRLRLAAGRRVRRHRKAEAPARHIVRARIYFSACPGSRDADRASSGGYGTTPSYLADQIAIQRGYHAYKASGPSAD